MRIYVTRANSNRCTHIGGCKEAPFDIVFISDIWDGDINLNYHHIIKYQKKTLMRYIPPVTEEVTACIKDSTSFIAMPVMYKIENKYTSDLAYQ